MSGLVQGWDLSEVGIHRGSSGVVFTAPKTFLGPVHVTGSFNPLQGVNGIDFSALCQGRSLTAISVQGNGTQLLEAALMH